ncbi:MAG TPA: HEAT repeat domain-containing protein [Pyrinomonadaceae bacterium]
MGKTLRSERIPGGLITIQKTTQQRGNCSGNEQGFALVVALLVLLWIAPGSSDPVFAQTVTQVSRDIAPATLTRLQGQIANGSVEVRRAALFEIRNLKTADASRLALPALRDKEPIVRASAPASIIFLPRNEAARALIPLLSDRDEFVRREAAYALGDVGDPAATLPLLQSMQRDKVFEVRTAAAVALGKIGDVNAIDKLLAVLKTRPREEDEFLRRSVARSIGQIAQIVKTGNKSVLTPQNFLPDKFKKVEPTSGTIDPRLSEATDVLIGVLRNTAESDDTRREAAFSLGAIGDTRAAPVLETFVSAADPYLAEIAREALLKIAKAGT